MRIITQCVQPEPEALDDVSGVGPDMAMNILTSLVTDLPTYRPNVTELSHARIVIECRHLLVVGAAGSSGEQSFSYTLERDPLGHDSVVIELDDFIEFVCALLEKYPQIDRSEGAHAFMLSNRPAPGN